MHNCFTKRVLSGVTGVTALVVAILGTPASSAPAVYTGATLSVVTPNDPSFARQWHLQDRSVPGSSDWAPLFGSGLTGSGVTVAVLDTGVTASVELRTVANGVNILDRSANATDDNGHGTHVAGIIAQATDDGLGVAGIASGATILPVKVLDRDNQGTAVSVAAGVDAALARGARVLNLSLGGDHPAICASVRPAIDAGAIVVAAAGNDGGAVLYPAACPGVIAVGAVTRDGSVARYSNRGPELSVVAPGGDNTVDSNGDGELDGVLQYSTFDGKGGYYSLAGTSMAAAHVAGAAALVLQLDPSMTANQFAQHLAATVSDLAPAGRDDATGAGALDLVRLVEATKGALAKRTTAITAPTPVRPVTALLPVPTPPAPKVAPAPPAMTPAKSVTKPASASSKAPVKGKVRKHR